MFQSERHTPLSSNKIKQFTYLLASIIHTQKENLSLQSTFRVAIFRFLEKPIDRRPVSEGSPDLAFRAWRRRTFTQPDGTIQVSNTRRTMNTVIVQTIDTSGRLKRLEIQQKRMPIIPFWRESKK
jgi:hypothetical protein